MAVTWTLRAIATASIRQDNPNAPGDYYWNAWVENWSYDLYALIRFDLSQIPTQAIIDSAYLRWRMFDSMVSGEKHPEWERSGTSPLTIRANRITSDWNRSTVTYNTRPSWTSQDAPSVTDAFNQPGQYPPAWNVTTHVQQMVSGAVPNYGWLLEMTNYGGGVSFCSYGWNENTELVVTFHMPEPPPGQPPAPPLCETVSPVGPYNAPASIVDRVSDFDLVVGFQAGANGPVQKIDVQIFDELGTQLLSSSFSGGTQYNLLTANQFSAETDLTGFTQVGGAILARTNAYAFVGQYSLQAQVVNAQGGVSVAAQAVPGQAYSARVWARGQGTVQMLLRLKKGDGAALVTLATPNRQLMNGYSLAVMGVSIPPERNWQSLTLENVMSNDAALATVEIVVQTVGVQNTTWYMDAFQITPAETIAPLVSTGQARIRVPPNFLRYGQLYGWRAQAYNTGGGSGWTPLAYFRCTLSQQAAPTVQAVPAEGVIRLAYPAHPGEALAGYRIYRRRQGEADWRKHIDLVAATTADDDVPVSGQVYEYQVAAVAADGHEGPASAAVSGSVTLDRTWIDGLALDPPPRLDRVRRPFVGEVAPVLGSDKPIVQRQSAARQYELAGTLVGLAAMEALEHLLDSPGPHAYRDPFGFAFRFEVVGDVEFNPTARREQADGVHEYRVEITEVD